MKRSGIKRGQIYTGINSYNKLFAYAVLVVFIDLRGKERIVVQLCEESHGMKRRPTAFPPRIVTPAYLYCLTLEDDNITDVEVE